MSKFSNFCARPTEGFTLIELMVVVLIVTILTVIAVPSYLNQTLKSHRTEAKSALMDLAARQERFLATNGTYSTNPADMGYTGTSWGSAPGLTVGSGYYGVTVNVTAAAPGTATTAATPATFSLTATAINGQLKDTSCKTLTITNAGLQTAADSSGANATSCW